MSKGSKRRPQVVDNETFTDNWNRIFCFDGVLRPGGEQDSANSRDGLRMRERDDSLLREQVSPKGMLVHDEGGHGEATEDDLAEQITRPQFP